MSLRGAQAHWVLFRMRQDPNSEALVLRKRKP